MRAVSQKLQSIHNRLNIINLIRTEEVSSRIELSKKTGLKTSTVSNIINSLIREGLVIEKGVGESFLGRKPKLIELNPLVFSVIGVEIDVTHIAVGLMNVRGNLLTRIETPIDDDHDTSKIMSIVISSIEKMLLRAQEKSLKIRGIGIGVMGVVEPESGILRFSLHHHWRNLPIKSVVEEKFKLPVVVDNDSRAMALGEYWFGAGQGARNLVLINISDGVGSGVIIDGKLYYGVDGIAGEIGHASIDYRGARCGCGNFGCLETFISGLAITKRVKKAIKEGTKTIITSLVDGQREKITGEVVCEAAEKGDELSLKILRNAGKYLGVGIINVVNSFNPEMVIIGGRIIQKSEIIFELAKKVTTERILPITTNPVKIIPFLLGVNAGVIGAATLVAKDIFYPTEEKLPLYWSQFGIV
jgi:glucokinase-like ROK family protein